MTHQVADAHARADAGRETRAAAGILCRVAHGVCGLQLSVGCHIEHSHVAQFLGALVRRLEVADVEGFERQADGFDQPFGFDRYDLARGGHGELIATAEEQGWRLVASDPEPEDVFVGAQIEFGAAQWGVGP